MVKIRICLALSTYGSRTVHHGSSYPFTLSRRFLDPIDSCLVPVTGLDDVALFQLRKPLSPRLRQRRINPHNLRMPLRVQRSTGPQAPAPTRVGLVNARSLSNKTFILRDLFNSRDLDFLCVTETWINAGECSPLVELLPADCSYFNSPRALGRGGGTGTVFKGSFNCKQCPASFSSFELTAFEVGRSDPVLCAVIYCPPKYNKDFLSDFSNFLAGVMPKYDRVLLVGDFNLHVCCPDKPMVKDFLNIVDSFNLKQCVSGPTHEHGHTLDLVLSHGLTVSSLEIGDCVFSDHAPILFSVDFSCVAVKRPCQAPSGF